MSGFTSAIMSSNVAILLRPGAVRSHRPVEGVFSQIEAGCFQRS
jgi:hypothetical protein